MMIHLLNQLPKALSTELFSSANWQSILQLAESLPPLSGGGLEVHLNAAAPRNDLMMRATSTDHGREVLAGRHADWHIPAAWLQGECWQQIQCFGKQWSNPDSTLYTAIENVWLEFDILPEQSTAASTSTKPSIFFDLDRHRRLSEAARNSVLDLALTAFNRKLPVDAIATLQSISNKLTSDSYVYYAGLMLSRSEPTLRVCMAGLTANTILPALRSIGCGEHSHTLQTVIDKYTNVTDKLVLHLDVGEGIGSKVGIEIFKSENNWPVLFKSMSTAGFCTSNEASRVLNWPGNLPLTNDHFRASLSKAMKRDVRLLIKRINHVKFVSTTSGDIETKAYLYFGYH